MVEQAREQARDLTRLSPDELIAIINRQEAEREEKDRVIAQLTLRVEQLLAETETLKEQHSAADALIGLLRLKVKRLLDEMRHGDFERIKLTLLVEQSDKKDWKDQKFDILNPNGFAETVREVRELLKRSKTDGSKERKPHGVLMMIDIDYFKKINDTHGHLVGDEALQALISKLKLVTRNSDVLGRFGGEEFLVFFPEASVEDIYRKFVVGEGESAGIRVSFKPLKAEKSIEFTVSGGIVPVMENDDLNNKIREADKILYKAKAAGRNQILEAAEGKVG